MFEYALWKHVRKKFSTKAFSKCSCKRFRLIIFQILYNLSRRFNESYNIEILYHKRFARFIKKKKKSDHYFTYEIIATVKFQRIFFDCNLFYFVKVKNISKIFYHLSIFVFNKSWFTYFDHHEANIPIKKKLNKITSSYLISTYIDFFLQNFTIE